MSFLKSDSKSCKRKIEQEESYFDFPCWKVRLQNAQYLDIRQIARTNKKVFEVDEITVLSANDVILDIRSRRKSMINHWKSQDRILF